MPNHKAFQKALDQIVSDKEGATKAYKNVPDTRSSTKEVRQCKFLKSYNRINQTPFKPITERIGIMDRQFRLVGLKYTHDGITEEIDFRKPENEEYKNIFEQTYMKMELYQRTQSKNSDLVISKGVPVINTNPNRREAIIMDNNIWRIGKRPFSTNSNYDPVMSLATDDAGFIEYIANDIRKRTKNKKIVLETKGLLLTKQNSETGMLDVYVSETELKAKNETKWERAKRVMTIDPEKIHDVPFDAICSRPESLMNTIRYPDYISEINLLPIKNGTSQNPKIDIQTCGMPPTKKEQEEMRKQAAAKREKTYDLLSRYSRCGTDKKTADALLQDYKFRTNGEDSHLRMHCNMSEMLDDIRQQNSYDVLQKAVKHDIDLHNIDAIAASYMSKKDGELRFFPIYDKSDGQTTWHVPIAIAAMHNDSTQDLYGILRMDDPEVKNSYERSKAHIEDSLKIIHEHTATMSPKGIIEKIEQMNRDSVKKAEKETNAKKDTRTPEQVNTDALLSKFQASLTDMQRTNRHVINRAYQKAVSTDASKSLEGDRLQRKFLKELAKLTDSPFEPIDTRGKHNIINMTGIRFTRKDETYDFDFTKDEYKRFKKAFDNAFLEMTLDERTKGCFREITEVLDYKGNMTVKASGIAGYSSDPLDRKTAALTARMIQKTNNYNGGHPFITIETKKTLLIKHNPESKNYTIYASDAHPNDPEDVQWEQAYPIMHTNGTMPPIGFDITAIRHTGHAINDMNAKRHISEIKFGIMNLDITEQSKSTEFVPPTPGKTTSQKRTNAFALMTEYAKTARTKLDGDIMLKSAGLDPDANHDKMIKDIKTIEQQVTKLSNEAVHNIAMRNKVINPEPDDIGEIASTAMRRRIGDVMYYPMYDRTKDYREKNSFIGIAAVNPSTYDIKGFLRADDPEANQSFKNITEHISEKLGFCSTIKIPQPSQGNRYIPESQKPDFMREDRILGEDEFHFNYGY